MAFLYSSYITMNAILSAALGTVIDNDYTSHGNIISSLKRVGGIQFSICSGIILIATLIPKGALSLNPKVIDGVQTEREYWEEGSSHDSVVVKDDIEGRRRDNAAH